MFIQQMNQPDFHILEAIAEIFSEIFIKIEIYPNIPQVWLEKSKDILHSFLNVFSIMNFQFNLKINTKMMVLFKKFSIWLFSN